MWPHEYVLALLWCASVSWGLVVIASSWILWDLYRTEPIEPPAPRYIYDYATDSYVRIPWT